MVAALVVSRLHLQRIAARVRFRQAKRKDSFPATCTRQVAFFLIFVSPDVNWIFTNGSVAGEKCADAGSFATDASQGAGVGHRVSSAPTVCNRDWHAEDVVFATQHHDLIVEAMLDVAQLLNGPNFLAKRFYIGQQLPAIGGSHRGTSCGFGVA